MKKILKDFFFMSEFSLFKPKFYWSSWKAFLLLAFSISFNHYRENQMKFWNPDSLFEHITLVRIFSINPEIIQQVKLLLNFGLLSSFQHSFMAGRQSSPDNHCYKAKSSASRHKRTMVSFRLKLLSEQHISLKTYIILNIQFCLQQN